MKPSFLLDSSACIPVLRNKAGLEKLPDPALVGLNEGKPYVVKTQNVVADLIVVVQQQQKQIEELKRLVAAK